MHGADKVVNPVFMPEPKGRKEGIAKDIPVVPKSMSKGQRKILPVIPRKGQGRAGPRLKLLDLNCNPYHNHCLSLLPNTQYPLY